MAFPLVVYATPRSLPRPASLTGRVVVLDIAFATQAGGASFDKTTAPFLRGLGDRLAMWIDHHDHERHVDYAGDERFVLRTKAQHGACPELVTPERVAFAGTIDTMCIHVDFDGICSGAKWIRGGEECYEGCDADARAIDTRLGVPTARARTLDRALRARPKDDGVKGLVLRYLVDGAKDASLLKDLTNMARPLERMENESRKLASRYEVQEDVAVCDARIRDHSYDKTELLLLGQELATISVVHDDTTVTAAARFDSGVDLLNLLGLDGGMPTRVSVDVKELDVVLEKLRARVR